MKQLRLPNSPYAETAQMTMKESMGNPKVPWRHIDDRGDDFVVIDGVRFSSRILAVNLQETHRVFPYVATCGVELDAWAKSFDDLLQRYWADQICQAAVRVARLAVVELLQKRYQPGKLSRMGPGSLTDWPIEEQRPLFRLLGDTENTINVRLTDSMLMVPTSRYRASTCDRRELREPYARPRPSCPNRRALTTPICTTRYRRQPA